MDREDGSRWRICRTVAGLLIFMPFLPTTTAKTNSTSNSSSSSTSSLPFFFCCLFLVIALEQCCCSRKTGPTDTGLAGGLNIIVMKRRQQTLFVDGGLGLEVRHAIRKEDHDGSLAIVRFHHRIV